MDIQILPLVDAWLPGTRRIFNENTGADRFPTPAARDLFCHLYFEYYRIAAPELFLVARTEDSGAERILGYVCALRDTREHRELHRLLPHIPLFDDLYDAFPAHFHINLAPEHRRSGTGGRLIAALERRLRKTGDVPGLHLVTSEGSRNVSFYRREGFTAEVARDDCTGEGPRLLFMGKVFTEMTQR